jgi:hypothetical protein
MFGSSGHRKRPSGLLMGNRTSCALEGNCHQKSIINPRKAVHWMNPRHFVFEGWRRPVDKNHRPRLGTF